MRKKLIKSKTIKILQRTILAFPFQSFQDKVENVGYFEFKNINGIQKTRKIINSVLAEQKSKVNLLPREKKVLGFSEFDLHLSYIQINYSHTYDDKFITKPVSFCLTNDLKIWYPIKYRDQFHFIKEGIEINAFVCNLLWKLIVFLRILNQLKSSLIRVNGNRKSINWKNCSLVLGANALALKNNNELYNFRNWFESKIIKKSGKPNAIYIDVSNSSKIDLENDVYTESLLFKTSRFRSTQILMKTFCAVLATSAKAKWKISFLILINFKPLILAQIYRKQDPLEKPNSYYFTSLYGNSMPLWAVDEMLRGKEINFLFLASYSEPRFKNSLLPQQNYWQLSRWPHIYLIDKIQEVQLGMDKNEFCKTVHHIGTPDWIDESTEMSDNLERNIFLFDGEMQKNYKGLSSMYEYGWDEISTNIKFIEDVITAAKDHNIQVYLKPKRNLGPRRFKSYAKLLDQINSGYYINATVLNENISVRRLCKRRGISISKPFSTSGLVSKEESMVTVFYDPLGNKFDGDEGLRGIKLISNIKDLQKFLSDYVA